MHVITHFPLPCFTKHMVESNESGRDRRPKDGENVDVERMTKVNWTGCKINESVENNARTMIALVTVRSKQGTGLSL